MTTDQMKTKPRRRWLQFSLRTLLMLMTVIGCGLGLSAAYFDDAQIDGDVYLTACACGFTHATIADGKVVLAEPNHDTPAGTAVATIRVKNHNCTVTLFERGGASKVVYDLDVDHLGAKYVDNGRPVYVVLVDNWKVYPARFFAWLQRVTS
jgi:hypothetical protein